MAATMAPSRSSSFAMTLSGTFAGAAAVGNDTPSAGEDAPTENSPLLGRSTTRHDMQETRQALVQEELHRLIERSWRYILINFLLILLVGLVMVCLLIWAFIAACKYGDKPCDQPMLKYYVFITLAWGVVGQQLHAAVIGYVKTRFNPGRFKLACFTVFLGSPGWCIIGWGWYMIHNSKTCLTTNPELYYPTKYFIYAQILMALVTLCVSVAAVLAGRYLLIILSRLIEAPGCRDAVAKLPKVPNDSVDLIDKEDGKAIVCAVCFDSLAAGGTVVRCPCAHHYHEDCISEWCRSHLDCPLCRERIGDPDGESPV